jgi:hypothetical protein
MHTAWVLLCLLLCLQRPALAALLEALAALLERSSAPAEAEAAAAAAEALAIGQQLSKWWRPWACRLLPQPMVPQLQHSHRSLPEAEAELPLLEAEAEKDLQPGSSQRQLEESCRRHRAVAVCRARLWSQSLKEAIPVEASLFRKCKYCDTVLINLGRAHHQAVADTSR